MTYAEWCAYRKGFAHGWTAAADALVRPHRLQVEALGEFSKATAAWLDENLDDEDAPDVAASYHERHGRAMAAHDEFERARVDWEAGLVRWLGWRRIERAVQAAEGR